MQVHRANYAPVRAVSLHLEDHCHIVEFDQAETQNPHQKTRSLKNAEAYLIYSIRAASWVQGFADKQ